MNLGSTPRLELHFARHTDCAMVPGLRAVMFCCAFHLRDATIVPVGIERAPWHSQIDMLHGNLHEMWDGMPGSSYSPDMCADSEESPELAMGFGWCASV